jgi:hypothetical protein
VHSASSTTIPPHEHDPFMYFSNEEWQMTYLSEVGASAMKLLLLWFVRH